MHFLESMLDRYTMYRVILAVLLAWVAISLLLAVLGWLPFSPLELLCVLVTVLVVSALSHYSLKWLTKAPANFDSTLITALILFFLYLPTTRPEELYGIALVAAVAVSGKYVFAYRKLHIANPAALAAVLVGLAGFSFASWWIATPVLLPFIAIGGLLVAVKLRRVPMVVAGLLAAMGTFAVVSFMRGGLSVEDLEFFFYFTPAVFFFTIMVTEPLTTPGTERLRIAYAVAIGVLSNTPFEVGFLYNTPELSLLVANVLFYPFSLRRRLSLTLIEKKEVAKQTLEFTFRPDEWFQYLPGQYLEWTLPHQRQDIRGIRRYFTIASAPSEKEVKLTVRLANESSSFKKELKEFQQGDVIHATARAGDFVLPEESEKAKYIFIAGGIGVTPFRSIVKEQLMQGKKLDAVLFYLNKTEADIAYSDLFDEAKTIGLAPVYILDKPQPVWSGETGYVTEEMLQRHATDYKERLVYISGPPPMVRTYTLLFKRLGVPQSQIKTDYFPGLA